MKRFLIEIIVMDVAAIAAFVVGPELRHKKGYATAWIDCRFDAKSQYSLTECKAFWNWYDDNKATIRRRRSLFQVRHSVIVMQ